MRVLGVVSLYFCQKMGLLERAKKRRSSSLAQRYLAAIEGDAIELLLPQSPGQSKSSHNTKSTKHTVRTVGESSDSLRETPTPRRNRLIPQQQLRQDASEDLTTPGSLTQREESKSASKMGFFPRTQMLVSRSGESKVRGRETMGKFAQQQHKFPEPTIAVAKKYNSDDDDSSLTSRRTSESARSQRVRAQRQQPEAEHQQHKAKAHFQYHHEHPLHGHIDDSFSASTIESSSAQTGSASPMMAWDMNPYQRHKQRSGRLSPVRPLSMESTFDDAVEQGLDMILNSSPWASCSRVDAQASSSFGRNRRQNGQDRKSNGRNGVSSMKMMASPRQRKYGDLQHSLSTETPRSDITGASTAVATNRAVDLAMNRIRTMECDIQKTREILERSRNTRKGSYRTTAPDESGLLRSGFEVKRSAANSLLSTSSNESSKVDARKRLIDNDINQGRLAHRVKQSKVCSISSRDGTDHCPCVASKFSESLPSSVGVEIDNSLQHNTADSTLQAAVGARNVAISLSVAPVSEGDIVSATPDLSNCGVMDADSQDDFSSSLMLPYLSGIANDDKKLVKDDGLVVKRTFRMSPTVTADVNNHWPKAHSDKAIDRCMSPPAILRKSQSQDEPSPDPIFCSTSLSISINSSHEIANSSSHSSVGSSFQSEDAIFMERQEELCSLPKPKLEQSEKAIKTGKTLHSVDYSVFRQANSGRTMMEERNVLEQTSRVLKSALNSGSNSSGELSSGDLLEREDLSTYLEVLGSHRAFPRYDAQGQQSAPAHKDHTSPRSTQNESFQSKSLNQRLVPLVSLVSPSPQPSLPPVTVVTSSGMCIGSDAERGLSVKNSRYEVHRRDYSGVVDAFLTEIKKKDPERLCRHGAEPTSRDKKFVERNGPSSLTAKFARVSGLSDSLDFDQRSVDVKSIRSAFESSLSPVCDDDDDDTASVKSLRERFECPANGVQVENGIAKVRALFDVKKAPTAKRFEAGSSQLKETFSKFEASSTNHRLSATTKKEIARGVSRSLPRGRGLVVGINPRPARKEPAAIDLPSEAMPPVSVADRIRAFGGKQVVHIGELVDSRVKAMTTEEGPDHLHKKSNNPLTESFGTGQCSPKQKTPTWRALSEMAFKCGPVKEATTAFPFDENECLVDDDREKNSEETFVWHNPHAISTSAGQVQLGNPDLSSETKLCHQGLDGVQDTQKSPVSTQRTNATTIKEKILKQTLHPKSSVPAKSVDIRKRVTNPSWLAQREKILSRTHRRNSVAVTPNELNKGSGALKAPDVSPRGCKDVNATSAQNTILVDTSIEKNATTSVAQLKREYCSPVVEHEISRNLTKSESKKQYLLRRTRPVHGALHSVNTSSRSAKPCPRGDPQRTTEANSAVLQRAEHIIISLAARDLVTLRRQDEETMETTPAESFRNHRHDPLKQTATPLQVYSSPKQDPNHLLRSFSEQVTANCGDGRVLKERPVVLDERPAVVKPVARKPYVRPVPMKAVLKPIPIIPFAGTPPDLSASRHGNTNRKLVEVGVHRFVPGVADVDHDKLALPRLVDNILAPLLTEDLGDSEDSEFSDGVTLDLSIADVSNLTNPTALRCTVSDDGEQIQSVESEHSSGERSKAKSICEAEAKRSEASSSQTSEAATPLIAKAMRTFPFSDEVSTDSFFRTRVVIAKKHWKDSLSQTSEAAAPLIAKSMRTIPLSDEVSTDSFFRARSFTARKQWNGSSDLANTMGESQYAATDPKVAGVVHEGNIKDDLTLAEGKDGFWDMRLVEFLFPVQSESPDEKMWGMVDQWQPFSSESDRAAYPKTGRVGAIRGDEPHAAPSGSRTPTRGNMSRSTGASATVHIPTLNDVDAVPRSSYPLRRPDLKNADRGFRPRLSARQLGPGPNADLPHPPSSLVPPSGLLTGQPLPSGSSDNASSTFGLKRNTIYGPKHAAVLERLRSLRESRLSRAAAIYRCAEPYIGGAPEYDEQSCSTRSPVRFGGNFTTILTLD